jgi:hypothetical protein
MQWKSDLAEDFVQSLGRNNQRSEIESRANRQGDRLYQQKQQLKMDSAVVSIREMGKCRGGEDADEIRISLSLSVYRRLGARGGSISIFLSAIKPRVRQGANAAWLLMLLQYLHLPGAALYFAPIFQNTLRAEPHPAPGIPFISMLNFLTISDLSRTRHCLSPSNPRRCEPQMQMHFARAIL